MNISHKVKHVMMFFVVDDDDNRQQFSNRVLSVDNLGDYLKQSVRLRMGLSTCCGLSAAVGCESFVRLRHRTIAIGRGNEIGCWNNYGETGAVQTRSFYIRFF